MRIGSNRMRLVLIIITYLLFIPAGNTADFSKYKSTCSDIGFTPDTDPFADCVLKLYKRDKNKVKAEKIKDKQRQDLIIKEQIQEEKLRLEKVRKRYEARKRNEEKEKRIKQQAANEKEQRLLRVSDAAAKWADKMQKDLDKANAQAREQNRINNKTNRTYSCTPDTRNMPYASPSWTCE
tara:strand:- start:85 stop:624 length:540 start_codon:yes stop_codon:yes gene_type:complete